MAMRYIALIPAYEPDRKMLGIIADLGKRGFDVVAVDDGSGVEYSELFEQAAERIPGKTGKCVTVLIHDRNKGKGAALKTGLDFIGNFMVIRGEEKETVVVTVDADGQHLAADAGKVACEAGRKPGTLVLGSRNIGLASRSRENHQDTDTHSRDTCVQAHNTAERPPLRSRFGNAVTRQVFRAVTGKRIYDTQTGLRAFTADLIPAMLAVSGDRYEYEINVLMEFAGAGIPIEETGIETVYHDGNSASHFNTGRDSYRVYKAIGRYVLTGTCASTSDEQSRKPSGILSVAKLLQAVKFSASSFVSFLIDYAMYAALLLAGLEIVYANIGARLISAAANYTINRRLVFRSGGSVTTSALRYFALAAFVLAGNTIFLQIMTGTLGIGRMAAKIFTEIIFFLVSWTVQKYVIFYNELEDEEIGIGPYEGLAVDCATDPAGRFTARYTAVRPKKLKSIRRRGSA